MGIVFKAMMFPSSACLIRHLQKHSQLLGVVASTNIRLPTLLNRNATTSEQPPPPKKVHQLKQTTPPKVPSWHKIIPFKSLRTRSSNKLKPAVVKLNLHGTIAANMGGRGMSKSLNIGSTRKSIDTA